ncbi:MAG TPA: 50S ribosomal protein L23 [Candidatus Nanoarchaeia archaeon]|nr:50S ribosomal protein L23 [Candidatus Nanoarchaeia archaeon]
MMQAQKKESGLTSQEVIKHPLATEKVIRLMEAENKLVFVVDKRATKEDVKKAIEHLFKAKVKAVNTLNSVTGEKRAYVTFAKESPAIDIATNLGIM